MFREVGLAIILIIYLLAVYTLCATVGLALHFPFRNCELEGSIVDVGVLKQEQIISGEYSDNNYYYIDPKSGNFYPILTFSKIKGIYNVSYEYSNGKMSYKGVVSFHKLAYIQTLTWWDVIWQFFSQIKEFLSNEINLIISSLTWIYNKLLSLLGIHTETEGMNYFNELVKPVYKNPKFEFDYVAPYPVLIDEPLKDPDTNEDLKPGEFYIICITNYIKADTGSNISQ